ncbi:MAG: hypothetical protein QW705_08340 [Zestosphaera sp.]
MGWLEVRLTLPYTVKQSVDFPYRVKSVSRYDLESIVLDVALQPRITVVGRISGKIIGRAEGVVVGSKVVENAVGFPHKEYGLAVKKSVKGFEVHLAEDSVTCEDVRTAGLDGAFLVACYRDKHANIYLASFTDIVRHEDVYRARPVKASVGFQSGSVVFEDGRSVVLYQDGFAEVGMPIEAIAFLEDTFYGSSAGWVVSVDVHSMDIKPAVKSGSIKFSGFLEGLPAFHDGSSLYVLDGGSLVRRGSAAGEVSAWKDTAVADSGERLIITDPYGRVLADIPKDVMVKCEATKHGVMCFRENMLGIVDHGRSFVEVDPIDSEDHAVAVSADTTLYVVYKDGRYRVNNRRAVITDKNSSVLREHVFDLVVNHLLGDEYVVVRSPARRVEVNVGDAKLVTSSAMHRCGGYGVLELRGVGVVKPTRVALEVAGKPLTSEVCLDRAEPEEVLVEAVDTLTGDRVEAARVRPAVEHVGGPQASFTVKHYSSKSVVRVFSDGMIVDARLCCSRVCRDVQAGGNTISVEVRDCRLPAWVEVTVEKRGFIFHERLNVEIPNLVDAVLGAASTTEYRVGGFHTTIPIPDYPDIPPIHGVKMHILPGKLAVTLNSRVIGRGVAVAEGRLKPLVIKNGLNTFEVPFSEKVFLVIDAGRRWLYTMELTTEALIKVADRHAWLLKHVLRA